MEPSNEGLPDTSKTPVIIRNLQAIIASFLLTLDEINTDIEDEGSEFLDMEKEVKRIELLLRDIQNTQKIANKIFSDLTAVQKKCLSESVPGLHKIFGWEGAPQLTE